MGISKTLLPEFDQEMATTRRVLERVPTDKGSWKPHPKSFPMGHLAQLASLMPGWLTQIIQGTKIDLAGGAKYSLETTETLLATFDRNVREAREAIAAAGDKDFSVPWSLTMGEKTLMTLPRAAAVRQTISHLVHHRAQLGVYLRLVDVPVPSMYGPTADEGW